MMEAASEYVKIQPLPEAQFEGLNSGRVLWHDKNTSIYYPDNPLVPAKEGVHLRIESEGVPLHPKTPEEWKGWLQHWAKTIGAGKVVSEGQALPDMWQSFIGQTEYSPEGHLVTDIIGRNPKAESWGKTAPLPDSTYDHRNQRMDPQNLRILGDTLTRYFGRFWVPTMKDITLFAKAPEVSPPESPRFKEVYERNMNLPYPWQSEPLLVSDTFDVVAILEPHLKSGIHLMIGVAQAPRRPWRDVTRALQGLATAEMTAQLLEETKFGNEPIAAWTSVRATGSWFGGFQKLTFDPAFKDETAPRKWLKRRFSGKDTQVGSASDWSMNFHPHVYGARHKDELIRLTQRPKNEGGADWEGIVPMSPGRRAMMKDVLNTTLPKLLMERVAGPISS